MLIQEITVVIILVCQKLELVRPAQQNIRLASSKQACFSAKEGLPLQLN